VGEGDLHLSLAREMVEARCGTTCCTRRVTGPPSQIRPAMARILIIDDDKSFREALAESIRDFGHDVVEASGAQEAFKLIDEVDANSKSGDRQRNQTDLGGEHRGKG
jgi:PleD family two-component response regulator